MQEATGSIVSIRPVDVPGLTLGPGARETLIAAGWTPPPA